jgi:hypothetical protein
MEKTNQTNTKEMTDKQHKYIKDLLVNQRIDEKYKRYVERALQKGITCPQATKIINFLTSFIAFKENFVRTWNGKNIDADGFKEAYTVSNEAEQQSEGGESEIAAECLK